MLGSGAKSGYTFTCGAAQIAVGPPATFYAFAVPSTPAGAGMTGTRTFTIAEDGVLRGKVAVVGPADHTEATTSATWPPLGN